MKNQFINFINDRNTSSMVYQAAKSIARYNKIPIDSYVYKLLLHDLERVIAEVREENAIGYVNKIINTLNRNSKVYLIDTKMHCYEGFVVRVNDVSITINLQEIDQTFKRDDIVEISVI